MSELIPFFDEDEQLDDNLLRSIETLLDDNEQGLNGIYRENKRYSSGKGMINAPPNSPVIPQFETSSDGSSFAFGNQVYQKWSTSESTADSVSGVATGPKRNYGRNNQSRSPHFVKSPTVKKNNLQLPVIPNMRNVNVQIAQYQAMLAEKANHLLNQYLRLNYEFLSAQAQILGIPLDQYIRNLLVALNGSQSAYMMPPSPPILYGTAINPMSPLPSMNNAVPNIAAMQQRAFAKQSSYFNSYNNKKN